MTKIAGESEYRAALQRVNELRSSGARVADDRELADLEAAIFAYEQLPRAPAESKGKPTPDPYDVLPDED